MERDRPLAIPPEPPKDWRERIETEDEMIGYLCRRLERDYSIQLSYQTVWHVLKVEREYRERSVKT